MIQVDFIYEQDCPNIKVARANLMRAFSRTKRSARWVEHDIDDVDLPERVQGYGSPTILIDGVDVAGERPGTSECCRVYSSGGAPSVEMISAALGSLSSATEEVADQISAPTPFSTAAGPPKRSWKSTASVLPGLGIALLPKVACPMCWPAYAGVLSALGLGFLMEDVWLLPISLVLLGGTLASLAWSASSRRGKGPFYVGGLASATVLLGKFSLHSMPLVYAGAGLLLVACIWNIWPRRKTRENCGACSPAH